MTSNNIALENRLRQKWYAQTVSSLLQEIRNGDTGNETSVLLYEMSKVIIKCFAS